MSRRNKGYGIEFYTKVMNDKDIEGAIAMMGPEYIWHNPAIPDGKGRIRVLFEGFRATYPEAHADVKRAVGNGDYVFLHAHFILDLKNAWRRDSGHLRLEGG